LSCRRVPESARHCALPFPLKCHPARAGVPSDGFAVAGVEERRICFFSQRKLVNVILSGSEESQHRTRLRRSRRTHQKAPRRGTDVIPTEVKRSGGILCFPTVGWPTSARLWLTWGSSVGGPPAYWTLGCRCPWSLLRFRLRPLLIRGRGSSIPRRPKSSRIRFNLSGSGKGSGQHRHASPKSLSDLCTSQPTGTMERGSPPPAIASGFHERRDSSRVAIGATTLCQNDPGLGKRNGRTPSRKLGSLLGELSPMTVAEFGDKSEEQIEPDNKHTLLQWASVAQVTKVIPGAVPTTAESFGLLVVMSADYLQARSSLGEIGYSGGISPKSRGGIQKVNIMPLRPSFTG
jgi:hypothetical protein